MKRQDLIRHVVDPADFKMIVSNIGVVPDFSALYTSNAGPYTATIQVELKEDHKTSSFEYMDRMRHEIASRYQADPLYMVRLHKETSISSTLRHAQALLGQLARLAKLRNDCVHCRVGPRILRAAHRVHDREGHHCESQSYDDHHLQ